MQVTHLSSWPHNEYSRIQEASLKDYTTWAVLRIPRRSFRKCGITFREVSRANEKSKYYEMSMHLFLEIARQIEVSARNQDSKTIIDVYPYIKLYLEWVPHRERPEQAVEYRLHMFLFHSALKMGDALENIFKTTSKIQEVHVSRSSNSRAPDPINGIQEHQSHLKVHPTLYYQAICPLVREDDMVSRHYDMIRCHGVTLNDDGNFANPANVFTLRHALNGSSRQFPTQIQEKYNLMSSYMKKTVEGMVPTFPDYSKVIRLSEAQFDTAEFVRYLFPEYQANLEEYNPVPAPIPKPANVEDAPDEELPDVTTGVTLLPKDVPMFENTGVSTSVFSQFDTRSALDRERERIDKFTPKSDIEIMEAHSKDHYNRNVRMWEGTEEFEERYRSFQNYAIHEWEARCLTPEAEISDPGKCMIQWYQHYMKKCPEEQRPQPLKMSVQGTSVFASRIIKILSQFEHYLMVSTQHLPLLLAMHGRYDAFRYAYKLHLHFFWTGEGATSKSFILDTVKDHCINGTVEQLTYQTTKARAVDGNQDDKCTFFHEAPPGMFSSSRNKNNDTTMEAMFKELLTSMRVAVKTIYMREDGKRETRTADCSHIGSFFCATNDDPEYCEEALRTRFYWGIFPKKDRSGRDIDDCQNGKRNMTKMDTTYEMQMRNYFKIEQYRVWMIEQLIRCNIIQDVDMTVANTMLQQVKTELHNRGIHASSTRDWERVKYLCRCLCIPTALDIVFNLESSPFKDMPFEVSQLLAVEPHLYVTEEMFMFAFSLMSTQFCSSIEHKVLSKLYNLHKLTQNQFGDDRGEINSDYIRLKKKTQLSKILQNNTDTREGKTSLHHINAMLNKLTETSFSTRGYVRMQDGVSGFPEIDVNSAPSVQQCAHATLDNFYIHVGYIMKHANKAHDPVMDVIRSLNFENSHDKALIVARAESHEEPYKMKFVRRTQGSKRMEFNNVLFNTRKDRLILGTEGEENSMRKRQKTVFEDDIDDVARARRCKTVAAREIHPVMCTEGVISIKDY